MHMHGVRADGAETCLASIERSRSRTPAPSSFSRSASHACGSSAFMRALIAFHSGRSAAPPNLSCSSKCTMYLQHTRTHTVPGDLSGAPCTVCTGSCGHCVWLRDARV